MVEICLVIKTVFSDCLHGCNCQYNQLRLESIVTMASFLIERPSNYQREHSSVFICILTSVRGMQVSCRYPNQCHGYAGALQVLGVCRNPSESLPQCFPGCVIRRLSICTGLPHRESDPMGGAVLFNIGIQIW